MKTNKIVEDSNFKESLKLEDREREVNKSQLEVPTKLSGKGKVKCFK